MRIVVQRVKGSEVTVKGRLISGIKRGLVLLVGICKDDSMADVERLAGKVINLRIFEDAEGKMNLNIKQIKGQILSVPQFTLCADIQKGNRPGFDLAADPKIAKDYWERFNAILANSGIDVKGGAFGEHMELDLTNDGPVTIVL